MALVSLSPCSARPFPTSDRWICRPSSSSSSSLHISMAAASSRLRCRPFAASSLCSENQTVPPSSAVDTPPSPSLRPSPRTSSGPLLVSAFAPSMNSTLLLTASNVIRITKSSWQSVSLKH